MVRVMATPTLGEKRSTSQHGKKPAIIPFREGISQAIRMGASR